MQYPEIQPSRIVFADGIPDLPRPAEPHFDITGPERDDAHGWMLYRLVDESSDTRRGLLIHVDVDASQDLIRERFRLAFVYLKTGWLKRTKGQKVAMEYLKTQTAPND